MGKYTEEILRTMGGRNTAKEIVARGPRNASRDIVNQKKGWPKGTDSWSANIPDKSIKGYTVTFFGPKGKRKIHSGFTDRDEAEGFARAEFVELDHKGWDYSIKPEFEDD